MALQMQERALALPRKRNWRQQASIAGGAGGEPKIGINEEELLSMEAGEMELDIDREELLFMESRTSAEGGSAVIGACPLTMTKKRMLRKGKRVVEDWGGLRQLEA
ncbi:unnamed protein product [Ilex paraguariensis]|uniref:Uncharacterized protein n=1 Tax=Ilex paraguariensis TaxID=185542 RepID=A0ABC8UD43_9AQUA